MVYYIFFMAQFKLFAPNFSTNRFVGLEQITYALQCRHPTANLFSQSDIKNQQKEIKQFCDIMQRKKYF